MPSQAAAGLPTVDVVAQDASLGAVCREIAKQAGITLIYPEAFDGQKLTLELKAPADTILDGLARRSDFRFAFNNGVGLIGKPLVDDRSIAVVRTAIPDPERILSPLLSETGKVTSSGGWVFLSDRSENLQRVVRALHDVRPSAYAVQLLEVFTLDGVGASLSITPPKSLRGTSQANALLDSQIAYALQDRGAYLGRTWTGVVSEGKPFRYLSGSSESRDTAVITANDQVLSNEVVVQTGWKLEVSIFAGSLDGQVAQDASNELQYTIPFACPVPGLYLVHASDLSDRERIAGLPLSLARDARIRRYIWLRFQPLGQLIAGPPLPGNATPSKNLITGKVAAAGQAGR